MAIVDPVREARQCIAELLEVRGITLDKCIIEVIADINDDKGWYKFCAIDKKSGARLATSWSFPLLITGTVI